MVPGPASSGSVDQAGQTSDETTTDNMIYIIAGSAGGGGLLLVIIITLLAVLLCQRNKKDRYGQAIIVSCPLFLFKPAYIFAVPLVILSNQLAS